jgi:hypothetical protein
MLKSEIMNPESGPATPHKATSSIEYGKITPVVYE